MTLAEPQPDNATCPRCGAGLRCGMVAGDTECWCFELPLVMPVPSALPRWGKADPTKAACFCPACLKQITDERNNKLSPPRD